MRLSRAKSNFESSRVRIKKKVKSGQETLKKERESKKEDS